MKKCRLGNTSKGILLLISGTMAAQLVSLLILPILSRVYTPEVFGYYSVVMAMVGIMAPVATLRYESAAMLPSRIEEVRAVVWLALAAVCSISMLTLGALIVAVTQGWLGEADDPWIAAWVPAFLVLGSVFTILSQLAIRKQQYGLVAQRSLLRALLTGAAQFAIGWGARLPCGLLLGSAIGSLGGLAILWTSTKEFLAPPKRRSLQPALKSYWRFPAIFTPSALLNALGANAPLLFLTATFGLDSGGQLGIAEKVVAAPIALVGGAVSQAIDAEAAKRIRDGQDLSRIFRKFSLLLTAAAIALAAGGGLFGGYFVPLLLGNDWKLAGTLVQIIAVLFAVRLVSSPLSKFMLLLQKSAATVALDLVRVGLVGLAMLVTTYLRLELITATWTLYSALAITYAATLLYVFKAVQSHTPSSK